MRGKMREWWRKSKERGREAAKGRSVENCASAHVRLILWDDRGLTAQIKTTPCTVFQIFPSLIVLLPSLFPSLLFSPWWSLPPLPLPSPVLSRNSTQHPCLDPFACVFTAGCALQSNQSFAKDQNAKAESSDQTLPNYVRVFSVFSYVAESHQPQPDNF